MGFRGLVERGPPPVPGVVGEQAGPTVTFVFDHGWPDHEFDELSDEFVGQHHPEHALDEVGHFLSEERGVEFGGSMTALVDSGVSLFGCPRGRRGLGGDPFVSPLS